MSAGRVPLGGSRGNLFHVFSSFRWLLAFLGLWPHHSSLMSIITLSSWPRPVACWVLVPWPGFKPAPPAMEARHLNHWTARKSPHCLFHFCSQISLHLSLKRTLMITHHTGPTWIIQDNLPRWRPLTITLTKSLLHDLKLISGISTCISLGPYHSQVWELLLMSKLFLFGHKWYFLS